MRSRTPKYDGFLALNKPAGMTSHDVVDRVRRITGQQAVGHTGTLDPFAEGLLLMLLGRTTKFARFLTAHDKTYEAVVTLGVTSSTYDPEGIDPSAVPRPVPQTDKDGWDELLERFRGTIIQKVPAYSAVQVEGERLYAKSRRGEEVEQLPEREVEIFNLDLLDTGLNTLKLRVHCSKGTYIRTLANDIGEAAGCGAYLSELRRTAIGRLRLESAVTLEQLAGLEDENKFEEALLSIDDVINFGSLLVADEFSRRVLDGVTPRSGDVAGCEGEFAPGDTILVRDRSRSVLAIATACVASQNMMKAAEGRLLNYERVLH